jgi:hypothetical protein
MVDEIVTLPEDDGYESRSAPESGSETDVEQAPVLVLDQWLSPDVERPTKWVLLPTQNARLKIQAMTQEDFKKVRREAPMVPKKGKGQGQGKKMVKDEDWIQNQVIMRGVLEPKITDPKLLNHALAGDIAFIVTEISRLSGFDVDTLMRDALEL